MPPSRCRNLSSQDFLAAVTAVVGPAGVITGQHDAAGYYVDRSGRYRGGARCVVLPRTTAQVAGIVSLCLAARVPLVPQGGNTSVCGGSVPDADGAAVVLNLSRMNAVRSVDAAGNVIVVEAGCVLQRVQEAADGVNRLFPLSLGAEGSCQIGGNISTNAGGVSVLRYGNMRDLVLGLEVVLPDGRIWNGLRAVRKDSTGYDLKGLWIGAEGTLGIITAAALKLFPRPRDRAVAWVALTDPEAAMQLLSVMQEAFDTKLSAFELMSRSQLAMVYQHIADRRSPLDPVHPWCALIELSDTSATGGLGLALEDALAAPLEAGIVLDAIVARSEQQMQAFWQIRHSLSDAMRAAGMTLSHDVAVPISAVPAYIERTQRVAGAAFPDAVTTVVCHLGDGNVHFNLTFPRALWAALPDAPGYAERVAQMVQDGAVELGGTFVAEHGIGRKNRGAVSRYKSEVELSLLHDIKRLIDPAGIMNPGRTLPDV